MDAYEIKNIVIDSNGLNFTVEVLSDFIKDEYGNKIPEFFAFQISQYEGKEWLKVIDSVMKKRAEVLNKRSTGSFDPSEHIGKREIKG